MAYKNSAGIKFNKDTELIITAAQDGTVESCFNLANNTEYAGGGSLTPKYVVRNETISLTDNQGIITNVDESLLTNGGNYLIKAAFSGDWYYGGSIVSYDDIDGWSFDVIYLGHDILNIYQEEGSWIVYSEDINSMHLSIIVDDLGIEPEAGE